MAVRASPSLSSQIREFNKEALKQLRSNRIDEALVHLQRAGQLLHRLEHPNPQLPPHSARNSLKPTPRHHSARKPQGSSREKVKLAQAHLSECALRSKQGDHLSALQLAQEALQCLSTERLSRTVNVFAALAHYSEGVEWEHLREKQGAKEAYKRAVDVAKGELGERHPVTQGLVQCVHNICEKEGETANFSRKTGLERTLSPNKFTETLPKTPKSQSSKPKTPRKFVFIPTSPSRRKLTRPGAVTVRTRSAPKGNLTLTHSPLNHSPGLNFAKTSTSFYSTLRKPLLVPVLAPTPVKRANAEARTSSIEQKALGAISELERLKKMVCEEQRLRVPVQVRVPKLAKRCLFTANAHQLSPIPESASRTQLSPIVKLQTAVRAFLARRKYQKLRQAAITMQRRVRGHQVVSLYRNIRAAIICIQRFWRKSRQSRF